MSTATAPAPRSEIRDSKSEIDPPCHQPAPAPAHQAPSLTPESSSLTPQPPDQLALTIAAFLDGNMTLAEVCEYAEISLSDLHAWARSDWARERFEMIRQLSKLRDELIQAEAVPRARQVLVHLATIADPSESAASRESRRKAAVELVPGESRARRRAEPTSPPAPDEPEQCLRDSNGRGRQARDTAADEILNRHRTRTLKQEPLTALVSPALDAQADPAATWLAPPWFHLLDASLIVGAENELDDRRYVTKAIGSLEIKASAMALGDQPWEVSYVDLSPRPVRDLPVVPLASSETPTPGKRIA